MTATTVAQATLIELQAALRGGAAPSEALAATCAGGVLEGVARDVRLGRALSDIAAEVSTADPAADFLVRCLALTERAGGGGVAAVEHALTSIRDDLALQRLLSVRTAQARGTATVLAAVPVAAWVLLVALDRRMLSLYATPLGWLTGGLAVGLAAVSLLWMRRMTAAVARAAATADPLTATASPPNWRRAATRAAPAGLLLGALLGPGAGLLTGLVVGLVVARRGLRQPAAAGGAAEAVALIAVAVQTGMSVSTAFAEVARVAPAGAAPLLTSAARRTAGGWPSSEALADTELAPLGAALAAAERWGSPAAPALRALADDLRAERRTAVELAAERLQLALIFPTTLLTLPAFVLGVVPPLLWTTIRG